MTPGQEKTVALVREKFPQAYLAHAEYRGQLSITIAGAANVAVLSALKADPDLQFVRLADLCGADYLGREEAERFAVVYHLHSFAHNLWVRVRAMVPERTPEIETLHGVWPCASWLEREAFDMYGIRFRNHPDLRRILMPEDYPAFPLRKDYPVRGLGERNGFRKYDPDEPAARPADGFHL